MLQSPEAPVCLGHDVRIGHAKNMHALYIVSLHAVIHRLSITSFTDITGVENIRRFINHIWIGN